MEGEKTCPKDCKLCTFQQHAYCAAQLAYNNMVSIQELAARIKKIEESTLMTYGPLANPISNATAQSEDGAAQ